MAANTYAAGNCTWWVRNQLGWVPNAWGNAAEWWAKAQQSGFGTSQQPQKGAVAVWGPGIDPPWGFGHVAVVTDVKPDGSFTVSEMNWKGLGVVDNRNVGDRSNVLGFILPPGATPTGAGQSSDIFGLGQSIQQSTAGLVSAGQVAGGAVLILVGIVAAVLIVRPGPVGRLA